jgi:hypothetical protein
MEWINHGEGKFGPLYFAFAAEAKHIEDPETTEKEDYR